MHKKPNIFTAFIKYNTVALLATSIDFGTFLFLKNVLGIWYVLSGFMGSVMGGIVAFILNRSWVFLSKDPNIKFQIIKYILTWWGSILLNTYGLFLLVENTNISETFAKIMVAVVVGISYNFLLSRYIIFKK